MRTNNATMILDFRDPEKYIYNSDLVEFTEFAVQLKDLVGPNLVLGAKWDTNPFANYGNGFNLDPVITGDVVIQNNTLALTGNNFYKKVVFNLTEPAKQVIPQAICKFNYFPNYSGNPSHTQKIFKLGIDGTNNNSIQIAHSSTGDFVFFMYGSDGSLLHEDPLTYPIQNANEAIELLLSYEYYQDTLTSENMFKLNHYVNGTLFKTYTYSATQFDIEQVTSLIFGTDQDNLYPNFSLNKLWMNNVYEDLGNSYTVGYTMVDARFSQSPQKIESKNYASLEKLINIVTDTNGQEPNWFVRYTFQLDGVEYFFDRQDLTWKPSQDVNDISELSYMLQYKDSLIKQGQKFKCIPYLVTIKGDNTPSITSMVITYDEYVCCQGYSPSALVYGYVYDVMGRPVTNARIRITPSKFSVSETGNYILPYMTSEIRTGQNGYWDAKLALSTNFNPNITYNFEVFVRSELLYEKANVSITKEGTIKFDELQ